MFSKHLRALETVRLGELLLQKKLVSREGLEAAIAQQHESGDRLGEILIGQGVVSALKIQQILLEQKVKRWSASALLALGTTAGAAPQIMSHVAKIPIQEGRIAIGGVSNSKSSPSTANSQPNRELMRVSLASHPQPTSASPLVGFCHPTAGKGYLSQGNNSITHRGRMAYAYDIATPIGTPLYAMRGGTVIGVRDKYPDTGGGRSRSSKFNYVMIEHDGGYRSAYVHLQQDFNQMIQLQKGDQVKAGQLIGYTGNSGWSTGPHLHVEVQTPKAQSTNAEQKFGKTVPFAVHGKCEKPAIASR